MGRAPTAGCLSRSERRRPAGNRKERALAGRRHFTRTSDICERAFPGRRRATDTRSTSAPSKTGNAHLALAAAAELRNVDLADALSLVLLVREDDPLRYDARPCGGSAGTPPKVARCASPRAGMDAWIWLSLSFGSPYRCPLRL
jgi:hypothetical protein